MSFFWLARQMHRDGVSLRSILLWPIRSLTSSEMAITLRQGTTFRFPRGGGFEMLFQEIWLQEVYGRGGIRITAGATVVDIGSNIGMFALWAATRARDVTVIAVEPSPRMCEFLKRNLRRNRIRGTIVQAACGAANTRAILYSPGEEMKNTILPPNPGNFLHQVAEVDVITLDELFARLNLTVCDLLKLDCEGAEYDILLNATTSAYQKIRQIVLEYHPDLEDGRRLRAVEEMFTDRCGFQVTRHPITEDMGYVYARRA